MCYWYTHFCVNIIDIQTLFDFGIVIVVFFSFDWGDCNTSGLIFA